MFRDSCNNRQGSSTTVYIMTMRCHNIICPQIVLINSVPRYFRDAYMSCGTGPLRPYNIGTICLQMSYCGAQSSGQFVLVVAVAAVVLTVAVLELMTNRSLSKTFWQKPK